MNKFKLYVTTFLFLMFGLEFYSQDTIVYEDWAQTEDIDAHFMANKTKLDDQDNTYIAGATINSSGDYDLYVTKLDSEGDELWSYTYAGSGGEDDAASDLVIDASYNVYITGSYYKDTTDSNNLLLIKLNSTGTQQWVKTYDGPASSEDGGTVITLASSGTDVILAGASVTSGYDLDFIARSYDDAGNLNWSNTWDFAGMHDLPVSIEVGGGKVTLGGAAQQGTATWKFASTQFDESSGMSLGSTTSGGSSNSIDRVTAMTKDGSGNYYLTGTVVNGSTSNDIRTIKLDNNLSIDWSSDYNSSGTQKDIGFDVKVDNGGNVYVCGVSETSSNGSEMKILKYNSSGVLQWTNSINGDTLGDDTAKALEIKNNFLYVTGSAWNGANDDFMTIKYDLSGNEKWNISFNGPENSNDRPLDLAIDQNGDIIVAGIYEGASAASDVIAVKYTEIETLIPADSTAINGNIRFIANKGQVANTNDNAVPAVKYYASNNGHRVYFTDDEIILARTKRDTSGIGDDSTHRVDLGFNGGSSTKMRAHEKREEYANYYLQHIPDGAERVPMYDRLFAEDAWNGIDFAAASDQAGVRYYFMVNAGANPANISLDFDGHDGLSVDGSGQLHIATSIGDIVWPAPDAWYDQSGTQADPGWNPTYNVAGDVVTFNIGAYDRRWPLIFSIGRDDDPTRIDTLCWSTYFGGDDQDDAYGVDVDASGNQYVTGRTASEDNSFPETTGAFQNELNGPNAFLAKFQANTHQDLFVTYFGNAGEMTGYDVACNNTGSVYIVGFTDHDSLPVQSAGNAYYDDQVNTGLTVNSTDGFIAKFNTLGSRTWATYFGGSSSDIATSCAVDGNNRLIICGYGGDNSFPAADPGGNAYTQTNNGGIDGFIARFTPSDSLEWSTFYGGSGSDYANDVKVDANNNIFLAGTTYSSNFPTKDLSGTADYFDDILGGTSDDFLVKFNAQAEQTWATYIGGSGTEFSGNATNMLAIDGDNNIYMVGTTKSNDFPLAPDGPAFYDNTFSSKDGYIMFFQGWDLAQRWTTYLSGNGDVEILAITVDDNGKVYLAGGTSDAAMPLQQVNGLYYQDTLRGSGYPFADAFLMGLNPQRGDEWLTYFGGNHPFSGGDRITSLVANGNSLYAVGSGRAQLDTSLTYVFDDLPVYDPGNNAYFDNSFNGGIADAFITEFCTDLINGVSDLEISMTYGQMLVYPNPTTDNVTLEWMGSDRSYTVSIFDMQGKLIQSLQHRSSGKNHRQVIQTEGLSNGLYHISVSGVNSDEIYSSKLLKQ